MPRPDEKPAGATRRLGLIEAIVSARDQCPNAAVRAVAEQALGALRARQRDTLRQQVFLLLSAMQGWRGERAGQVHQALKGFLDESDLPSADGR